VQRTTPGLSIHRGLALLTDGEDGVLDLLAVAATAIALAAGVILGQYVAQPIGREGLRLRAAWQVLGHPSHAFRRGGAPAEC
jgi:uncharacterized membrane protein YjjB (DUF3815 family)